MSSIIPGQILRFIPIAIISGIAIAVSGFLSETIHLPFLLNILFSIGLGWLAPQKGWILAIVQAVTITIAYFVIKQTNLITTEHPDIADFTTYLALIPTLAGSYMGGFLKRAIS